MLILHPREVTFLAVPWKQVTSIIIDRTAQRVLIEHADTGPFPVFADVPEQRITVRVTMDIGEDTLAAPGLGTLGTLEFATAPTGPRVARHQVSMQAVVTSVTHEVSLRKGAVRTVELTVVAPAGNVDPVTVSEIT